MLDDRKKKVLQAIIEEYIKTAEPVGSETLVKSYNIGVSPATIRNDMAELENLGFLDKPHTSAGRIPSNKGYRFYVDQLIDEQNITPKEVAYIKTKLESRMNEIEDWLKVTTNTISEMTHYTTLAVGSNLKKHNIVDVKFVLLGTRMLMAIVVTDAGAIKETIIKFDEDISENIVEQLNQIFANKLRGKPLSYIDKSMEEYIKEEMNYSLKVITPIIQELNITIEEARNKIYLEGATKTFDFPELKTYETAKNFLNIIEEKEMVRELLETGFASDINVYIGDESSKDELKDFSIITFKHSVEGREIGTIGIIGPKRMDYSKVISIMKYISKRLTKED